MKKKVGRFVVLLTTGMLTLGSESARAEPGGGAQVTHGDDGCGVFVFDDDEKITGVVVGRVQIVAAPSGTLTLVCQAQVEGNPATRTIIVNGAGCSFGERFTSDTHNVQTMTGHATLACRFAK